MRQLEQELGIHLFLRLGRTVSLTDAGRALLKHAHTIDQDFERLIDDMKARKGSPTGSVVIGIPPTLADSLVPRVAEHVQRSYPGNALRIAEGVTPVLAEWVQMSKVDFSVISLSVLDEKNETLGLRLQTLVVRT